VVTSGAYPVGDENNTRPTWPLHQIGVAVLPIDDDDLWDLLELVHLTPDPAAGPWVAGGKYDGQHVQFGRHIQDDGPIVPGPAELNPLLVDIKTSAGGPARRSIVARAATQRGPVTL